MNKYFLILVGLFMVLHLNAQIEVKEKEEGKFIKIGTAKTMGVFRAELSYLVEDKDTVYGIVYKNSKYPSLDDYQHLTFGGGAEVLNQLYDVLKSVFAEENKNNKDYKKQFTLGEDDVIVSNYKLGSVMVMIWTNKGYFYLTEKELDKLFNKG